MTTDRGKWTKSIHGAFVCLVAAAALGGAAPAFAGFASTESFLPAVGRIPGKFGAEFYTTIWTTNLTGATVQFTFDFLAQNQANTSPASFSDTLAPGETKTYENVVETKLGLNNALGAARVTSDGEILVSERIYNQNPGDDLGKTEGLFFAGVPKSFSISLGQSASIQGIDQGGAENFRYNFALVETAGHSATAHVVLYDGDGSVLGSKDYLLQPYEQIQPGVDDLAANLATTNARITATVTAGSGSVLLAGAQLANESQDSSGFEMSFRDTLLGGGGGGSGVTSLNALTGALTIAHGANTTVNVNGSTITIDAVSGSGSGLTAVAHDNSLTGSGTVQVPLAIANGQVIRSLNGLRDSVTLAAGSNVTLTPTGNTLTIAASGGGGGGLTLPFSGTANDPGQGVFVITNSASTGVAVEGIGAAAGIAGTSQTGAGVAGSTANGAGPGIDGGSTIFNAIGVRGRSSTVGVFGALDNSAPTGSAGVEGKAQTSNGVYGQSDSADAIYGLSNSGSGVKGHSDGHGAGVYGENAGTGGSAGTGVYGYAGDGSGVVGQSANNHGVEGDAGQANKAGVYGTNSSTGPGVSGASTSGAGVSGTSSTFDGVEGYSTSNDGVYGSSTSSYGVAGSSTGTDALYAFGSIGATGAKSFVEPHASDPTKEIRYICLEGRESGTYFRGTGKIVGGFATIDVPEDFRMVTSPDGLTAVATPVGGLAVLAVVHQDLDRIVIQGSSDVAFNYVINGVRKAFHDFQPVSENRDFRPRAPNDTRFEKGLPAESVRRLKATGILNADGSINLETAHRLGWDRQEGWKSAEPRGGDR